MKKCLLISTLGRFFRGGPRTKTFFGPSIFHHYDPKKEENYLQNESQRGARGARHPIRPFFWPLFNGGSDPPFTKRAITSKRLELQGWGWSQSTGN